MSDIGVLTLVTYMFLASICYIVIDTVWSVYFGKLSGIPGPRLAAATRLVLIFHNARGTAEAWKFGLHRRYGDVVRTTPSEVSFATGAAWKYIYGAAQGSQLVRCAKDPMFYGGHTTERGLGVALDGEHARQRKCFNNAFSEKALREQETLVAKYVSQLVSNVMRAAEASEVQKLDLAQQYYFATFDIMADLAWGEPLGCLAKSEYVSWITMIFDSLKLITFVAEMNRHPALRKILNMMIPRSLKAQKAQHEKFSSDRVDKRLSQTSSKADIWHYVLAAKEKNLELTRGEMYANAAFFMVAGTETSATLLSALSFYLFRDPKKLKVVTAEIRQRFGTKEEINAIDIQSLKYLTACAHEAFRMHPPVPIGLPRVVPKGGAELCGYTIPEGTTFYVHHLSTYRNPRNFAHPDIYLLERWLTEDVATKVLDDNTIDLGEFTEDDRSCVQPFSVGPRNCIGQNLAWLEIRLIIVHMLWQFDFELCEDSQTWDDQKVFSLWATKPLMVVAKSATR